MADLHVMSALVAKRSELAGQAQLCDQELQRLAAELGHLDATIRLFAPAYDLGGIRPRKRRRGQRWFAPGECQRLVLEVLAALHKTSLAVLRSLAGKGAARAVELAGGGRAWVRA